MQYMEITIRLNRCAIEPVLAALDMIGIDDAEVRDPHDAEEIMADKETYEWDYVDDKVAAGIGTQPEIHIYHELADQNPTLLSNAAGPEGAADQNPTLLSNAAGPEGTADQSPSSAEAAAAAGYATETDADPIEAAGNTAETDADPAVAAGNAAETNADPAKAAGNTAETDADPAASSDSEFLSEIKDAVKKVKKGFDDGAFGEGQNPGELEVLAEVKDDSSWKDKWKEFFRPSHISDRIVVKPTWEEYEPESGEIVIEIDPGMAFGTGTHETTSMCMRALEKYVKPGMSVLDAGCGSGILSIAAAKLGAADVLGVDIDEEAVRVSEENFSLNGTAGVCRAVAGDVTKGIARPEGSGVTKEAARPEERLYLADIVAANLMAELLCMISQGLADHMKNGGVLISSGILNEKEEMVKAAFENAGLSIKEVMHDGEWCCVIAEK